MKKLYYIVALCLLTLACTHQNEPNQSQRRIQNIGIENEYENLYQQVYNMMSTVQWTDDFYPVLNAIDSVGALEEDLDYETYSQIIECFHLDELLATYLEDAVVQSGVPFSFNDGPFPINESRMDSIFANMLDSVYITHNYRSEMFEDDNRDDSEKFLICIYSVFLNHRYSWDNDRTLLMRDTLGRYSVMQSPNFENLIINWQTPLDIIEINIEDLDNFNQDDIPDYINSIMAYPNIGVYHPFDSYQGKAAYLMSIDDILSNYDDIVNDITVQECKEIRDAKIDELENDLAARALAGTILVGSPKAYAVDCLMNLVYYGYKRLQIQKEYRECKRRAEAEQNN